MFIDPFSPAALCTPHKGQLHEDLKKITANIGKMTVTMWMMTVTLLAVMLIDLHNDSDDMDDNCGNKDDDGDDVYNNGS